MAVMSSSVYKLSTSLFLLVIFIHVSPFVDGASFNLVHRDSAKSPHFDPSKTPFERVSEAIARSFKRASHLKGRLAARSRLLQEHHAFGSPVQYAEGDYLMEFSIGTPPLTLYGVADTGSDLIWTQCQPCAHCYKQDSPIFAPGKSSTYRRVSCNSTSCHAANNGTCDASGKCRYEYLYGDKSYTIGDLSTETFSFRLASGRKESVPNVIFGCGRKNNGTFNTHVDGIIGLGTGALSLVSQMKTTVEGKFSYCLVPMFPDSPSNASSTINFGSEAVVSGPGVVSTPVYPNNFDSFYVLNLEGLSLRAPNSKVIKSTFWFNRTNATPGNIVIDSGTPLTFLPPELYHGLEAAVQQEIKGGTIVPDPMGMMPLCYKPDPALKFPDLVLHFTGGDIVVPSTSCFMQLNPGAVCLTLLAADQINILGNLVQTNFHIGYDAVKSTVSFKPTDCAKLK